MIDHLASGLGSRLSHCQTFILDEADRLLEQGFADPVDEIIATLKRNRASPTPLQTLLFSATMSSEIKKVCLSWMCNLYIRCLKT